MINCEFENGNRANLRHVTIDALVVNDRQDKLLLEKRADNLLQGGKWCLPGGFLERNETISEAVRREIKEETGYDTDNVKLFRINDNPDRKGEDRQNVTFVFLVTVLEKTGSSDDEVEKIKWFEFDKLPPEQEFAFDHHENVRLYLDHKQQQTGLPLTQ